MMTTEEHPIFQTVQARVVIIDGCTEEYEKLAPLFVRHFQIRHVALSERDQLFCQPPPDAVIIIVGKAQYADVIRWIRQIRQIDAWHYVPIIPYLNLPEEMTFLNAGATECWIHPIPYETMILRLKKQLEHAALITDYRNREAEYRQAYLSQSHLIEIASHDIQHPINDLLLISDLLQRHSQDDTRLKTLLSDMDVALNAMQETLKDFLTALYLRGQIQFKPQLFPVAHLLFEIGVKYGLRAAQKHIEVVVGDVAGYVYAEPRRVAQIVENLVSNAVKYSPSNTQVTIWSETSANGTYIRVRDQGPGIAEAERHLLFREFSRLSTRPTGNESSIGLGLWVVKKLTQAMGGDVGATFPDEGGSIFWVRLPNQPPV